MRSNRFPRHTPSAGYSLLELVASVAIVAGTLVPAMELMRTALQQSIETDRRMAMASYGVSEMERLLASTAAAWTTGSSVGDFASDGQADIRFEAIRSDDPADGGISDALMDLRVTTYYDENGDDSLSGGEPRCEFHTKLGKFATYEAIAQ